MMATPCFFVWFRVCLYLCYLEVSSLLTHSYVGVVQTRTKGADPYMSKIFAIANQKGGTGKTTLAVNLGAAFLRKGYRVKFVDMDPQASLTEYFISLDQVDGQTIYNAIVEGKAISPLQLGELATLLPANIDLAAAELQLPKLRNYERVLVRYLRQFQEDEIILIDCPPSLGILTTISLTTAHQVIVPVSTELMGYRTIRLILDTVEDIKTSELNESLAIWSIIPTLYDQRLNHHKDVLEIMREEYKEILYDDPMRLTVKYKDAVTQKVDIAVLDGELGDYWDRMAQAIIPQGRW